jgi:hypothetical protein
MKRYKKKMLSDCDMYVVRIGTENMGNPLKYSRPCPDCSEAIIKAGIKKIYYSTSDEFYCKIENFRFGSESASETSAEEESHVD